MQHPGGLHKRSLQQHFRSLSHTFFHCHKIQSRSKWNKQSRQFVG